jgi:hypothetical protein
MPDLINSVPLFLVSSHIYKVPMGRLCNFITSQDGMPLSEFSEFTHDQAVHTMLAMGKEVIAQKDINVPSDFYTLTVEQLERMRIELVHFAKDEGMYFLIGEWVAQKMT